MLLYNVRTKDNYDDDGDDEDDNDDDGEDDGDGDGDYGGYDDCDGYDDGSLIRNKGKIQRTWFVAYKASLRHP